MDTSTFETTAHVEQQLVDVVIRHELDRVPIDVDDFSDWHARRAWSAITAIWQRGDSPTIWNAHDELCEDSAQVKHQCSTACDLMFATFGRLEHVDDYVVVITNAARRRRLAGYLADAATSIATGADPDAVLNRLQDLVA